MKKQLLFLLFLLASLFVEAQNPFIPQASKFDFLNGIKVKKHLVPPSDTLSTADSNSIAVINGQLYIKFGPWSIAAGGGGLTNGDKGDITVGGGGSSLTIDNLAITDAKINSVAWSKLTSTPTTLSGYGITDARFGRGDNSNISGSALSFNGSSQDFSISNVRVFTNEATDSIRLRIGGLSYITLNDSIRLKKNVRLDGTVLLKKGTASRWLAMQDENGRDAIQFSWNTAAKIYFQYLYDTLGAFHWNMFNEARTSTWILFGVKRYLTRVSDTAYFGLGNYPGDPATYEPPQEGYMWMNDAIAQFRGYRNGQTQSFVLNNTGFSVDTMYKNGAGDSTVFFINGRRYALIDNNSGGGGGMSNPMTTAGDIIVGGSSGTPGRLGIGSALQVLRVNSGGTALEWATPSASGVTNFSAGDLSPLFTTTEATTTTTPALSFSLTNAAANTYFGNATGSTAAPSYTAAGALTKTDDTNVTLTLGGNASTALLRSASITVGWTGTLADARIASAATWNAKQAPISENDDNLTFVGNVLGTNTTPVALTDGATITWVVANGINASVTLAGNRTLAITSPQSGKSYLIEVTQDATGSRTLTLPGGGSAVLDPTATNTTVLTGYYNGSAWRWFSSYASASAAAGSSGQVQYNSSGSLAGDAAFTYNSGLLSLGAVGTIGQIDFYGSTSGVVSVKSKTTAGTWTLTLPNSAGTNGQALTTDGSGNLAWTTISGSGANALGTYLVQTATNAPANAQILGSLSTGLMKVTTTTGVVSTATAGTDYANTGQKLNYFAATTSAELAGVISNETGSGALAFATSPTLVTPVLGVATATSINKVTITAPTTSATLTLVTGSSLITSGAFALTLTSTATTNATFPSGTVTLADLTTAQTFTNKRITARVGTTASSATPTPDADNNDVFTVTALAVGATFAAPTGTPTNGQTLVIRIKDNGTAQTLAWNAIYRASTDFALPTTTVISKTMYLQFMYNSADTKWDAIGYTAGF